MMKKKLPGKECNLFFTKTVERWDEAIPLGNGLCGALVWGTSRHLRFSLDRGDIWDVTPYPGIESEEFRYKTMVELAHAGKADEIRRIFDAPYNHVLPSKLPAGKLIFDFQCEENVCSELSLAQAETTLQIGKIQVRSFLHARKNLGYIEVNCVKDQFSFRVENPEYSVKTEEETQEYGEANSVETASLKQLYYKAPEIHHTENTSWFIQEIDDTFSYGIFVKSKEIDGKTLLVYAVANSHDGEDWREKTIASLEGALENGYENERAEHAQWWKEYWEKSSVTLPDAFFEKNWYLTNYLLASCSRKGCYPMPLQGVWTADDGKLPPWKGDYHHDLNTQLSYYSYLKANHLEEGESFLDYLWNMRDCARAFAKKFYDSKGLCLPAVMAIDGSPLGGWGMYALSPTNQIWLCQAFERYYRYSGDKEFLKEKAYPYLSETAECILGLLEEKEGLYYLPISSSPEIHDDRIESFLTPNSNYDLALMRYLFATLRKLSQELENGEENRWGNILEKLPQLAVNEKGVLMVSPDESLEESHRHMSHAMSIHPLRLLQYENPKEREIIDATITDLERLGTGYWVGYSFTWMAEFYAIQKNGNGAAYQLQVFWNNCCSQNGFHLNGDYKNRGTSMFHYRPFTLEGNFCAADALQEMLLQSEDHVMELFPAVPEEWKEQEISFENFLAEQGVLVSATMKQGEIISLTLKAKNDCTVGIRNYQKVKRLLEGMEVEYEEQTGVANLRLLKNEKYEFFIK